MRGKPNFLACFFAMDTGRIANCNSYWVWESTGVYVEESSGNWEEREKREEGEMGEDGEMTEVGEEGVTCTSCACKV